MISLIRAIYETKQMSKGEIKKGRETKKQTLKYREQTVTRGEVSSPKGDED